MGTGNINFSINNIPQVDRHFNETLKNPIVNQVQNAEITQDEIARKLMRPVEVTHTEQKITDPNDHKKKDFKKQMRVKKRQENKGNTKKRKPNDNGYFVDVEG